MSLKQKSALALGWDLGGTLANNLSGFIISIFLARLLTPEEFGLVGMAMVFITVSQVFIDVGFASALIQNQNTTKLSYSSIFWLNLSLGLLLSVLFFFLAPIAGDFYNNQEITSLVRWLSLIFVFNSCDIVQMAILRQKLDFKTLSVRKIIANLVGGVAGVIFALLGFGIYSLVIQQLIAALLGTVLLWSTSDWRPDFRFSFAEVRKFTGYSTYVFFDRFFSAISQRLDIIVIGKVLSPATLGFYTRAVSLQNQVTTYSSSSISKVFFPVLSKLQDEHLEFSRIYFKVISLVSFISFGLTGLLYIIGQDIIILLFGKKWIPSITIFQILILSACNYPLNSMMINAFMSKGRSKQNFYIGLFRKSIRLIPLYLAYSQGIIAFCIGMVTVSYLLTIMNIVFLKKYTGLSLKTHFQKIFEGIIPLVLLISIFEILQPTSIILRLMMALLFLATYVLYNKLIGMEGYQFIKSNFPAIVKKVKSKF